MPLSLSIGIMQNGNHTCQKLEDHWNSKLREGLSLAPVDLVARGMVTDDDYKSQNQQFGDFVTRIMTYEVEKIIEEAHSKGVRLHVTEILGAGLARDLKWLLKLFEHGCVVRIHDISYVAKQHFERLYKAQMDSGQVRIVVGEVENTWDEQLESDSTIIFGSQFFQVQSKKKMQKLMCRLGRILDRVGQDQLQRRLYLVHPFRRDNVKQTKWYGAVLPGVQWGDTTPYSEKEITNAIEKADLKGSVRVEILGKHAYFHQIYSLLKVTVGV